MTVHEAENIIQYTKENILTSRLEMFHIFMVMFDNKQDKTITKIFGVRIKCDNCKKYVHYNMTNKGCK